MQVYKLDLSKVNNTAIGKQLRERHSTVTRVGYIYVIKNGVSDSQQALQSKITFNFTVLLT